jgi:large subunit ribosomal protein L25
MEIFELNAQRRTERGTGASRRLRHTGYIPAIIYGAGKEPVSLTISQNDVLKRLEYEAFYSRILTINIDNQAEKAVLKALQRHPFRKMVLHLDLLRVSDTEKIQMRIPLHFINEDKCAGVKQSGGFVSHLAADIDIRCLPKDLPEFIEVDLENVELNKIVHLSDLVAPEGVEWAGSALDVPIVSVHLARGTQEEDEAETETVQEEGEEEKEEETASKK